jgi:hypothetical protein
MRHLAPPGFRNLLALLQLETRRPYFRSNPPLGFALQSFSPFAKLNAISGVVAFLPLRRTNVSENYYARLQGFVPRESPSFKSAD